MLLIECNGKMFSSGHWVISVEFLFVILDAAASSESISSQCEMKIGNRDSSLFLLQKWLLGPKVTRFMLHCFKN